MSFFDYHHFPVYSIMLLFLGAFFIILFGKNKVLRNTIALLAVSASFACMAALVKPVFANGEILTYHMLGHAAAEGSIGLAFEVDALSLFFGLLTECAVFVSCIYSLQYAAEDSDSAHRCALFLTLSGSAVGLVLVGDVLSMFVLTELLSFAAAALVSLRSSAGSEHKASFRYPVANIIGSACVIAGTVLLYTQAHTLNLAQLAAFLPANTNAAVRLALILLFAGFSAKAFIVPAHAQSEAFAPVLISGALARCGIYGIIRLTYFLFVATDFDSFRIVAVFVGSVITLGSVIMALAQHDLMRLLAFHSVANIGCALTAVGLCTGLGLSAGLFHVMNHSLFCGLLFLAAGAVLHETGTTELEELGGLSRKMPVTAVLFFVGALSTSGLPPFNGFASVWMIVGAAYRKAAETGSLGFLLVTAAVMASSLLTFASLLRIALSVFFGKLPAKFENVRDAKPSMIIAMSIFALLCVLTGLFPTFVTRYLTEPAARAAFNVVGCIDAIMGSGYASSVMGENLPVVTTVSFNISGYWAPVSWLLILCIALLAAAITALSCKYDQIGVSECESVDPENELPCVNAENELPQSDSSRACGSFIRLNFTDKLNGGLVNDFSLWAIAALLLSLGFIITVL